MSSSQLPKGGEAGNASPTSDLQERFGVSVNADGFIPDHDLNNALDILKSRKDPEGYIELATLIRDSWAQLPEIAFRQGQLTRSILDKRAQELLDNVVFLNKLPDRFQREAIKAAEPEPEQAITRLGDRIEKGVPEIKWLIEGIVPDRGITIFGGASGSMKTFAAMEAALAICTGTDFLGQFTTQQTNVLYLDEENGDKTLISRFNELMLGRGLRTDELNNIHLSIFRNIKLDHPTSPQVITSLIQRTEAKVVVIDSMVRFMDGEEDKSKDVRLIFDTLKQVMASQGDISFIILHHTAKAVRRGLNSLRGSGDFSAFADCVQIYDGRKGYSLVETVKNRHVDLATTQPFIVKLVQEGQGLKMIWLPQNEAMGLIDACAEHIKTWYSLAGLKLFPTKDAKKICEIEGYKLNTINNALKKLIEEGELSKQKQGVYKVTGLSSSEENIQDD